MKHNNKITPAKPGLDPTVDQTVLTRLAALKAMSVKDLKAEWEKLIGSAAPNNSRAFLAIRIAYRTQELTYGGSYRETRGMLDLLSDEVEGVARRKNQFADPRNPVPSPERAGMAIASSACANASVSGSATKWRHRASAGSG